MQRSTVFERRNDFRNDGRAVTHNDAIDGLILEILGIARCMDSTHNRATFRIPPLYGPADFFDFVDTVDVARSPDNVRLETVQSALQTVLENQIHDGDFVSVESGAGWLQSTIEAFDWQWINGQVTKDHPEYDLLPSEYFKRQIYGCFWFENKGIQTALELFPENMMWETDFPHPTCQYPGPTSSAQHPRDYVEMALGNVPEETLEKVLHSTAARIYGIQ